MISVILPTRGRPAQAVACVKRLFETTLGYDVECVIVVDRADAETLNALTALADLPVVIHKMPGEFSTAPEKYNAGLAVARADTGKDWLVSGADDLYWHDGWLDAALAHENDGFIGLWDGHTDPSDCATHAMVTREFIEQVTFGYMAFPWYGAWYSDLEVRDLTRRAGRRYVVAKDAVVEHRHPTFGNAPTDETYLAGKKFHNADRRQYWRRKRLGFPSHAVEWGDDVRPIIGVPLERCVPYADETFWAFIAIAQQGWPFIKLPYTRVDVARNQFARHVLDSDFTHLVMLDLDHDHRHDVVHRLVKRVEEDRNRLVVSGLNFRRGQPYDPIAFVVQEGETYAVADWEPGEIMPVDLIGCGCVIVAREVFEQLPGPPWFWNDYRGAAFDNWPGEDITFSRLCRENGIQLWVDTATSSDHLIDGRVNEAVYRAYALR
jgi:glycosyltransferase involved in cell wall biosynthesis